MDSTKLSRVNTGRRSRFTLIEMLVVIAIIAILAGMLFPSLQGAINSARNMSCVNNQRQLNIIFNQYYSDNHGYLPPAIAAYSGVNKLWANLFCDAGYLPADAVNYNPPRADLLCPSSTVTNNNKVVFSQGHYGINKLLTFTLGDSVSDTYRKASSIKSAGRKVLLLDSGNAYIHYGLIANPSMNVWYIPGSTGNLSLSWNGGTYDNREDAHSGRHDLRINVLWMDGHVSPESADKIDDYKIWIP